MDRHQDAKLEQLIQTDLLVNRAEISHNQALLVLTLIKVTMVSTPIVIQLSLPS